MGVTCNRCGREAVGWPLARADLCSPRDWVSCIREPESVVRVGEKRAQDTRVRRRPSTDPVLPTPRALLRKGATDARRTRVASPRDRTST